MGRTPTKISLTPEDRDFLENETMAQGIPPQIVCRARILLLKAEGHSIEDIAEQVYMDRRSVSLCLSRFAASGIEYALYGPRGRRQGDVPAGSDKE